MSFRLPAGMNPQKVDRQFRDWLGSHELSGCRWEITTHGLAEPFAMAADAPSVSAVLAAVKAETGRPAALVREGATIPVGADLQQMGMDVLFVGFGLHSDGIHGPDEHVDFDRVMLGARTLTRLLAELASA